MINLNIEFSDNTIRILRLDKLKRILSKDEVNISFSLSDETVMRKDKFDLIHEFEDAISEVLKKDPEIENNDANVTAGILIGTEQTFLNVTPVDFEEDNSSVTSHIIWELSNYFPDTYKDFNVRYYRLNNNRVSENIDDTLLIAINKKKLEFIKTLCDSSGIKIRNIEIDHIVIEKCLKEKYPDDIIGKTVLVIGIKKGRVDFSLLSDGEIRYYDYACLGGSNLKYLVVNEINLLNSLLFNIENMFIYGEDSNNELREFLKEQFENTGVFNINYDNTDDTAFSPLYGLALKNV
ncbi:MAG: pilus assembly protein PilM [Ignavibacteria bacterium]